MAGFVRGASWEAGCGEVGYSPSAGASSSRETRVSISPDFSPVLVFTKKYFMKTFGAAALGAPCLLSKSSLMSYSSQTASRGWAIWTALP